MRKPVFQQKKLRIALFVLLGCIFKIQSQAQSDTSFTLPEITIQQAPGGRAGFSSWTADTLPLANVVTLAERLLWESPLDVRANAPGALSTVSARGAGPARTAVFWENLNLQSPMNGVVDVALLPIWAGDKIEIQYGGNSAVKSGGAMGGAIQIVPEKLPDSTANVASIGIGLGSFGATSSQASVSLSRPKLQTSLRAAWQQAQNDFPYQNIALLGKPEVVQQNNFAKRFDIQHYAQLNLKPKYALKTAVWYQNAFREIPPAMTESPTLTWQKDQSFRAVITLETAHSGKTQWQHRLASLSESIAFNLVGAVENSRSQTYLYATDFFRAINNRFTLRANLTGWLQSARSDGYASKTKWFWQKRAAAVFMGEYHFGKFLLHAQIREEWAENQGTPFTWSLGGRWNLAKQFSTHLHISRNFNLPTFNDRYWRNLGNPNLRPESGYSTEAGLRWTNRHFFAEATIFQLLLNDWILWQPGDDGLFRPDNLRKVWSRGAAFSGLWRFDFWRSQWKIKGRYQFVRATNVAVYNNNVAALHKLLPYTPQHTASVSVHWNSGPVAISYLQQWTGARFYISDNSGGLPDFFTGNLFAQYTLPFGKHQFILNARLENCWNAAYQIIAYRPMPGRNWHLGLSWKI